MSVSVIVERSRQRRSAMARQVGEHVVVTVPQRWPQAVASPIITELTQRVIAQQQRMRVLLNSVPAHAPRVTFTSANALRDYVDQINAETFNVPLRHVRIGRSKRSHLALMNRKTQTITISAYCLNNVPESALRYLIIHELAHGLEIGHNKRFWGLLRQFVPDYKTQAQLMQAVHQLAVQADDILMVPDDNAPTMPATPVLLSVPVRGTRVRKKTPPMPKRHSAAHRKPKSAQPSWVQLLLGL